MDLRLFLKYYKDYDLGHFYKVNLVTKLFKREAYHGIWLNKEGFFKIHSEILNVPSRESKEDLEKKIARLEEIHETIITNEKVNRTLNVHGSNLRTIVDN